MYCFELFLCKFTAILSIHINFGNFSLRHTLRERYAIIC